MSTAMDKNVHSSPPPTPEAIKATEPPIKITIKNTINDNHDNQHNQFLNSKNFSSECVETEVPKNEAVEFVENSVLGLAKEECQDTPQANTQTVEFVENPESLQGKQSITSYYQSVEVKGKDGNTYKATPLQHYRFNDAMILEAISRSKKPHYTAGKVRGILGYILQKNKDMLVFGGQAGFVNYLVKLINGEKDYEYEYNYPPTQEEKAISMAEISNMKRIQLEKELVKNEIKWF